MDPYPLRMRPSRDLNDRFDLVIGPRLLPRRNQAVQCLDLPLQRTLEQTGFGFDVAVRRSKVGTDPDVEVESRNALRTAKVTPGFRVRAPWINVQALHHLQVPASHVIKACRTARIGASLN